MALGKQSFTNNRYSAAGWVGEAEGRRRGGGGGHPWQVGVHVKVVGAVDDGEGWKTREHSLFVNARMCPSPLVLRLRIVHGVYLGYPYVLLLTLTSTYSY